MSYIKFNRVDLVNLETVLKKELIRSNRAGSYASTTIIGCNTRKYHGLLIVPVENGQRAVLLSELEETVMQQGNSFRLGIRRYTGGKYDPHGHRYMTEFETDPIPARYYTVGGVRLKKELMLADEDSGILIRYTILDAHSPTVLRLQPYLAFRNVHSLSKANMDANTTVDIIKNGIKSRMYKNYPELYIQISKNNKYISAPDWYYGIEYEQEQERGYDFSEDLFVPGFFDVKVKKDDVIVFSASLNELNPEDLESKFEKAAASRIPRNNYENCLKNSAQQFFVKENASTLITIGYPWYGFKLREALIALPGLTLPFKDKTTFFNCLDSILGSYKFEKHCYEPDIPLLIIRTIQIYLSNYSDETKEIWNKYKDFILGTIQEYKSNKCEVISFEENGLLYLHKTEHPKTWMNEIVNGVKITDRYGYVVEINSLWYNSIMFLKEISLKLKDKKALSEIENIPEKIEKFFPEIFWIESDKYLYDFVNNEEQNASVRPNQLYALGLPYSPISKEMQRDVLKKVKKHLLTEKGLRTLSPKDKNYLGIYGGNEQERAKAIHQGTVHPWLIGIYCDAWFQLYGKNELSEIVKIYLGFEEEMKEAGIGTISELYEGNPPHKAKGAISFATSVSELLRIKMLIDANSENTH